MDARKCMIVDLERKGSKSMFITEQIKSIQRNEHGGWTVSFNTSSRIFHYNKARLLYLQQPTPIDLEERGLYVRNKRISNISEVLCFTSPQQNFYRVTYTDGYAECLDGKDVYITRTSIAKTGGSIWEYLKTLANETGLVSDDGYNSLADGYNQVDMMRDNVPLAQYLGDKRKLAIRPKPKQVYYPFGCNASQKEAVEAALSHQVSIIQGPPGTGKTQTILNIIANLLLSGKTILIVSNNNSAVENIADKLHREGLDFIIAQLGRAEFKDKFIQQQRSHYPEMKSWKLKKSAKLQQRAYEALQKVSQGFEDQTKRALLRSELSALQTEMRYNDLVNKSNQEHLWLRHKSPSRLMTLLTRCLQLKEQGKAPNLWLRLKSIISLGHQAFTFLKGDITRIINSLKEAYYYAYQYQLEKQLAATEKHLCDINLKQQLEELTLSSLQLLKSTIANRYNSCGARQQFVRQDFKGKTEAFLKEYPIVLSSAYKSNDNISSDYVFDYVIMDEASQIDIKTGVLALSCAMNAVIVGDDKQLPNVVSATDAVAFRAILESYQVSECYNVMTHSFLQSCREIFSDAPTTLLREHYRCHPKIIEFCNQHFYDGELIPMTEDRGEKEVLQVIRTVKGNHARGRLNQREIDVITQEVFPEYQDKEGSIGIITPYKEQANAINQALGKDIASTVHKYQGCECDTIILSMVNNSPTTFSDDANLINVAISRAKKCLCLVATGNDLPEESILSQLISYIQYNNFEVKESKLHSVFDILYQQYTTERLSLRLKHQVSAYLSENLFYDTLIKALKGIGRSELSVLCHYPLAKLIADQSLLDAEEEAFVKSPFAHVDFLIYNSLTKRPILVIEVDGWSFHKEDTIQESRDRLKDRLLSKYDLHPYRISTTEVLTVDTLKARLTTLQ